MNGSIVAKQKVIIDINIKYIDLFVKLCYNYKAFLYADLTIFAKIKMSHPTPKTPRKK